MKVWKASKRKIRRSQIDRIERSYRYCAPWWDAFRNTYCDKFRRAYIFERKHYK